MARHITEKILYVLPSWFTFYYGVRGQLSYLLSEGFCIDVVCEEDRRAEEAARREGVRYHRINFSTTSLLSMENFRAFFQLARLMRKNAYSIVYCTTKMAGLLGAISAKLSGINIIVYAVHGIMSQNLTPIKKILFPWIQRLICGVSEYVIFMSQSNMDYFTSRKICRGHKARLLGNGSLNGVDVERFQKTALNRERAMNFRSDLQIPAAAFVFGYVGRLVKEKGIQELGQAWSRLRQDFLDVHLLITSPPEVDETIADWILALRRDSRVHFTGFIKDPVISYGAMNCLVLPSYGEGLPNAVLEAGAMEVPAIASRVLGCVDAIVHEQTGLLVDPGNPQMLYSAMRRVLENTRETSHWGQNARERLIVLFNQVSVWKSYERFYRGLLHHVRR